MPVTKPAVCSIVVVFGSGILSAGLSSELLKNSVGGLNTGLSCSGCSSGRMLLESRRSTVEHLMKYILHELPYGSEHSMVEYLIKHILQDCLCVLVFNS
jgi:hypothetical protein